MRNRRPMRNSRGGRHKNPGVSYVPVIVILCLSVGCGYATAKYVVEPVVNYAPQIAEKVTDKQDKDEPAAKENTAASEKKSEAGESGKKVVEDDVKVESAGKVKGYALQYGSYSARSSAEKAMGMLGIAGLKVTEQGSMYKIFGKTYPSKDEAVKALSGLPEGTKAFVAAVY